MSLTEKSALEEKRERRVAALRELCKGQGVYIEDPADDAKLIEALEIDPDDFLGLMNLLEGSLPEGNLFIDAFTNALWKRQSMRSSPSEPVTSLNLTERREKFLNDHPDISARTLMRYEIEGANLFVRHVEIAEDMLRRERELEESEDAARDLDIAVLRKRIGALEPIVSDQQKTIALLMSERRDLHEAIVSMEDALTGVFEAVKAQGMPVNIDKGDRDITESIKAMDRIRERRRALGQA